MFLNDHQSETIKKCDGGGKMEECVSMYVCACVVCISNFFVCFQLAIQN